MSAVLNDLKTVMDQNSNISLWGRSTAASCNGLQTKKLTAGDAGLPRTVTQERTNTANSVDISQRWQEITVKTHNYAK